MSCFTTGKPFVQTWPKNNPSILTSHGPSWHHLILAKKGLFRTRVLIFVVTAISRCFKCYLNSTKGLLLFWWWSFKIVKRAPFVRLCLLARTPTCCRRDSPSKGNPALGEPFRHTELVKGLARTLKTTPANAMLVRTKNGIHLSRGLPLYTMRSAEQGPHQTNGRPPPDPDTALYSYSISPRLLAYFEPVSR